jgi:hypothetical protein
MEAPAGIRQGTETGSKAVLLVLRMTLLAQQQTLAALVLAQHSTEPKQQYSKQLQKLEHVDCDILGYIRKPVLLVGKAQGLNIS